MPASLPPASLPPSDLTAGKEFTLNPALVARARALVKIGERQYRLGQEGGPDEIVVESGDGDGSLLPGGVIVFTGGVKATYGVTTIIADALALRQAAEGTGDLPKVSVTLGDRTIELATEEGFALGNVVILDPDGRVEATDLRFRWREGAQGGDASNVAIRVGSVRITAARLVANDGAIELTNAFGTACVRGVPFLGLRSSRVTTTPARRGSVERPQLVLLGQNLPSLPANVGFSLDPRTEGFRLPGITYDQDRGTFGVSGGAVRQLDTRAQGDLNFAVFPGQRGSYTARYSRTFLSPEETTARIAPRNDLDERFFYSWFTNIFAEVPESETNYLRERRSGFGIASVVNAGAVGRPLGSGSYTKLVEGILETGGPLGNGGYQAQVRGSVFQESNADGDGDFGPRLTLTADAAQTLARRGRTTVIGRVDGAVASGEGLGAFAGGEVGVAYQPSLGVRFGASAFAYAQAGDSGYTLDRLRYPTGFSLRTDLNSAPTKFSLLLRFDERGRQFDREYRIAQVIGCLEPVLIYREFPRSYQIGLNFRIDDLKNLLQRRDPRQRRVKPDPTAR